MKTYKKVRLSRNKTIDEHRLIMQNSLGRKLSFNEVVHHKDGNKFNNSIDNLEVLDRSSHVKHHIRTGDISLRPPTKENLEALRLFNSTVTEAQARRIKYGGDSTKKLMGELCISKWVISRIRCNKTWVNI